MKKIFLFAAAALLAPVSQAQAAELIGDTISCQQVGAGSIFVCDMAQATVGAGREFTIGTNTEPFFLLNFVGNGLNIRSISDDLFTLGQTIIRLENLSQVFREARLSTSDIGGFDASDINLASGILTLDFRGTTWDRGDSANIRLTATSAVPEPSTWMMLILGLGAVGASMRFQRRRSPRGNLTGALGLGR